MYQKKFGSFIKHMDFMLFDMACLLLAFWISYFIRHGSWAMWKVPTYRSLSRENNVKHRKVPHPSLL